MPLTPEMMQSFSSQYDVVGHLTEELRKKQEKYSGLNHYIGWHPGYFYKMLMNELPSELSAMIAKDDFFDTSFVPRLGELDGVLPVMFSDSPALVSPEGGEELCFLTVAFCKEMFPVIEHNANAVIELAEVLDKAGEDIWFNVPAKVSPDDSSKRRAVLDTLCELARQKPKKFNAQVKANLHKSGFDEGAFSNNDIQDFLNAIIADA